MDPNKLEEARARLGEAVADPAQWVSLMEAVCAATGTLGAALLQSDVRTPDVPTTPSVRDAFKSYFDQNLHVGDVRAAKGLPLLLTGRTSVRDQDVFSSESTMLRDPLYSNLMPFNLRWFSATAFRSGPAIWVMSLQRTVREGMFEDDEMKALAALSQSLTEVATLSHAVGRQALIGSLNAFEMINEPALSMSSVGTVLETNVKTGTLFDTEFCVRNNRLYIRDGRASQALDEMIYDSLTETGLRLRSRARVGNTVVVRRESKRPILIRLLPVHGPARSPFLGARFILLLRDMESDRVPGAEMIAEVFSLTPAEAKVAAMIASGSSPEDISDTMQISKETVRNQIKAVFAKTGTHRQNELAALIARIRP